MALILLSVFVVTLYTLGTLFYRLFFHPLSKFPGPKRAAATFWYEFYFDVVRRGRYFKEIEKMHRVYGPIVRINPQELHINDPDFYSTLYTSAARKRNKWPWAAKMFGNNTSVFSTVSHDHHRVRRAPLNPLFSKTAVKKLEPLIHTHLGQFCTRLDEFCDRGEALNIGLAFAVFACDVISEYCFGGTFGLLRDPDFAPDWVDEIAAPSELGHLVKQFPLVVPLFRLVPRRFVKKIAPSIHRLYTIQERMGAQVQALKKKKKNNIAKGSCKSQLCVFDALVASSLPAQEKTVERLRGEGQTLIGAGTLTTANVLKTTLFHLLDNPSLLQNLLQELAVAFPNPAASTQLPDLKTLEKLPLLTACITEGLRMAYGVTHRLQLIAPCENLDFQGRQIPAGTPVGMTSIFMHDNLSIFPEPKAFRPQRWLDAERAKYLSRYFVTFGKGTRMCLGMHLAWAEIYLVLGCLLTKYRLELYETVRADVEMAHDFFDPAPSEDSKGLRVRVRRV